MGQYLVVGLCYSLGVNCSDVDEKKLQEITREVSKMIDIDAYDCNVAKGEIEYKPKENIFMDGFVDFVMQQYTLYGVDKEDKIEILKELANVSNLEEAIDLANLNQWVNYQKAYCYDRISCGFYGHRVTCSVIGLFIEGKAMLECYDSLFAYIETLIKKDNPYPVARFAKVILT